MLMPTKHIQLENSILGIGSQILYLLDYEKTVSRLFYDLQELRGGSNMSVIQFDWYLFSLDFLYMTGAIRFENGLLRKQNQ